MPGFFAQPFRMVAVLSNIELVLNGSKAPSLAASFVFSSNAFEPEEIQSVAVQRAQRVDQRRIWQKIAEITESVEQIAPRLACSHG